MLLLLKALLVLVPVLLAVACCAFHCTAMRPQRCILYASSVFIVNGVIPAMPNSPVPIFISTFALAFGGTPLSSGFMFSCRPDSARKTPDSAGRRTVCTEVTPPPSVEALPPQKREEEEEERSLCVLGVRSDFKEGARGEEDEEDGTEEEEGESPRSSAALRSGSARGGGRFSSARVASGESSDMEEREEREAREDAGRPARRVRLRAVISCLSARFSDCVDPSSERMASRRRSRSAMSPSRVDMYSVRQDQ